MNEVIAPIIILLPILCIVIGFTVGLIRYKKYGDLIKKEIESDSMNRRKQGEEIRLFGKTPEKKVVFRTFGIPIFIGMIAGIIMMITAFCLR